MIYNIFFFILLFITLYFIYYHYYDLSNIKFNNQIIIITGGASGIGYQLVLLFIKLNAIVIILDIYENGINKLKEEVKLLYNQDGINRLIIYNIDITDNKKLDIITSEILLKYKKIDILINNAGIVFSKSIIESNILHVKRTFDVNVISHFKLVQTFLPNMLEYNSGHIVTIASILSYMGCAYSADYCASKFAIAGFAEALRHEIKLTNKNVATTLVHPYLITTGMFEGMQPSFFSKLISGPPLNEVNVAQRIMDAIKRKEEQTFIPGHLFILPALHLLPVKIYDWIHEITDVAGASKNFKGRGDSFNLGKFKNK